MTTEERLEAVAAGLAAALERTLEPAGGKGRFVPGKGVLVLDESGWLGSLAAQRARAELRVRRGARRGCSECAPRPCGSPTTLSRTSSSGSPGASMRRLPRC